MPAYTPNVPLSNQTIPSTQPQINNNFLQIPVWTNVDHVQISGAGGNEGKHAKVSLIQQPYVAGGNFTPAINPTTGVGTVGIYAAQDTTNNGPSRMWAVIPRKTGGVWTTANIPFTLSALTTTTGASDQNNWTYLPSGIIIQNGTSVQGVDNSGNTGGPFTVTFPIPFPNKVLTIIMSPFVGGSPTEFSAVAYPILPDNTDPSPILSFTTINRKTSGNSTGQSGIFRYIAIGF